jgi:uncharacterized membrane protein
MKSKILALTFLVLFVIAFTSALTLDATSLDTFNKLNDKESFTITGDENFNITDYNATIILDQDGNEAEFTITPLDFLEDTNSVEFEVELTNLDNGFEFGEYSGNIFIEAVNSTNSTINDTIEVPLIYKKSFYDGDNEGELRVTIEELDVSKGYGEDNEWYLFDEIEIEIEIDNRGNWDIEDIEIEACLYSVDEEECVLDERDMDLDESLDLDEGDEETITAKFILDADEFKEGDEDFKLYVKAVGKIDDRDSSFDGDETGSSDSEDVSLILDRHFVILTNLDLPETLSCGEIIQVSGKLWNIGDEDEEDILVILSNQDLGIDERVEIEELDILEDKTIKFNIEIPEDVEEGIYYLRFQVYDEDNDVFENDNDDKSEFIRSLVIEGNCILPSDVEVNATLESDSIAGKETTINILLTNTGSEQTTYALNLDNYVSWASLKSIEPNSLTLNAGETGEVQIKIIPNKDSEGEREFLVRVIHRENITEKRINLVIEPPQGLFDNLKIFDNLKENWLVWVIAAVNIILIILIIVVAIRIARR